MKELKEMTLCVVPFMIAAVMLFPFVAIVGGSTDPFTWERNDRLFYFIWTVVFGGMLLARVQFARKGSV